MTLCACIPAKISKNGSEFGEDFFFTNFVSTVHVSFWGMYVWYFRFELIVGRERLDLELMVTNGSYEEIPVGFKVHLSSYKPTILNVVYIHLLLHMIRKTYKH